VDPLKSGSSFRVEHGGSVGPRAARLETAHGPLETPAFFPVGTYGAVRGLAPDELRGVGVQGVLSNTYHLHLRPGEALVEELGGLHGFMGWSGPILTDSGGFQLHSLEHKLSRDEDGVRFQSPIDGSARSLSPESSVEIQQRLGADLICVLDEFEPVPVDPDVDPGARERAVASVERTLRWAERGHAAHAREDQWLFGIVQGGGFDDLRGSCAERLAALGFRAFAVGGLGLGESGELRKRLTAASISPLPAHAPRYLMGIGEPPDLVDAVEVGIDLFDCVVPTRHGRHGGAYTADGTLNLRNARFRSDSAPIDPDCACPACRGHSRAYLRHLLASGEALGARLLSLHNIAFYMGLMRAMREAIVEGNFESWSKSWRARYAAPGS
jgi:queuine tRNA-ribosyltransferase